MATSTTQRQATNSYLFLDSDQKVVLKDSISLICFSEENRRQNRHLIVIVDRLHSKIRQVVLLSVPALPILVYPPVQQLPEKVMSGACRQMLREDDPLDSTTGLSPKEDFGAGREMIPIIFIT